MAQAPAGIPLDLKLQHTRPEIVVAALLYLVTAYRRSRCPGLASCIARHFIYLSQHPRADKLLCDIASAAIAEWESAAREVTESSQPKNSDLLKSLFH